MFILNEGNSVLMNLAVILVSLIIVSFTLTAIWILLIEINLHINAVRKDRAEARQTQAYFNEIEEIRNDFI